MKQIPDENTPVGILKKKIQDCWDQISIIQKRCQHEDPIVVQKGDTGNYCRADDRFWKEYTCRTCGFMWSRDDK